MEGSQERLTAKSEAFSKICSSLLTGWPEKPRVKSQTWKLSSTPQPVIEVEIWQNNSGHLASGMVHGGLLPLLLGHMLPRKAQRFWQTTAAAMGDSSGVPGRYSLGEKTTLPSLQALAVVLEVKS